MALKGPTSRTFLYTTFLALDLSLLLQLITLLPTGVIDSRTITHSDVPVSMAVTSDDTDPITNVYVDNILALDVVQQPDGDANYVSPNEGEATQFSTVTHYGNIGLLAHNYLSGRDFAHLAVGQEVHLLYESGKVERFVITEILRYQALEPKNPYSSFQNMENENDVLTAGEMFGRAYGGEHHVTFQTCISRYGNSSWGRLFVLAIPKSEQPFQSVESQANVLNRGQ